jgi:hypothetical protein
MDVVLPDSPEAWAFVTVVFGAITSGIGWLAKRWADHRVARETAELTQQATVQAALANAQERLITTAEQREAAANARTDKALELNATLQTITTEQMATIKLILDEVRRGNGNYEALVRELSYRPRG